jgi:hypothetical protein
MTGTHIEARQALTYGNDGSDSGAARAVVEYPIGKLAVTAERTYDHFQYTTDDAEVPVLGGSGQVVVPSFYGS